MELDLSYVAQHLKKTLLWDERRINTAIRKYKNYLTLIQKYSTKETLLLVPTQDIDEAWHAHILHTKEYFADTQRIFGNYLHHAPSREYKDKEANKAENERMRQAAIFTAVLYEKEFDEHYADAVSTAETQITPEQIEVY